MGQVTEPNKAWLGLNVKSLEAWLSRGLTNPERLYWVLFIYLLLLSLLFF
jgi:hypothetical protein